LTTASRSLLEGRGLEEALEDEFPPQSHHLQQQQQLQMRSQQQRQCHLAEASQEGEQPLPSPRVRQERLRSCGQQRLRRQDGGGVASRDFSRAR